jgi:hypothetical protein
VKWSEGPHLATISEGGRFWDVYLEVVEDVRRPDTCRALLCFSPADGQERELPLRTAPIIIEPTYQAALEKARDMAEHQLVSMLRSCLPDLP